MKNLMTRKHIFSVLMALVLAFSVQGITNALTLTARSSVTQSARMGSKFEMSFSVGLTGNMIQNDRDKL